MAPDHRAPVRPRALRPGDAIGVVAPAKWVNQEALATGMRIFDQWGFRPVLGRCVLERHGHFAGHDARRAADLNEFFASPDIAAVWCARGGYGSLRLLPLIDWDLVRAHPKPLIGFSDITALHGACWMETGMVTFHGPMVEVHDPSGAMPAYNARCLYDTLTGTRGPGPIPLPEAADAPAVRTIVPGVARGRLLGGNLEVFTRLIGTPWQPDTRGALLVLEDVDEAPYRIDRMLTQLWLAGLLDGVAGVIFGHSPSCEEPPEGPPSFSLQEVLADLLGPLGVPVVYGFPCGHSRYRATLPLGCLAELDAGAGRLTLLEPAVALAHEA